MSRYPRWPLEHRHPPLDQGKMTGFIANGDRMRNPDVPVERGPNDFRVLSLGDSNTFGWGVRYEEAYPTRLADLLREARPGREIHVLNAACSGYSAHQGLEMLKRRAFEEAAWVTDKPQILWQARFALDLLEED